MQVEWRRAQRKQDNLKVQIDYSSFNDVSFINDTVLWTFNNVDKNK
jgi:hypothetical protein